MGILFWRGRVSKTDFRRVYIDAVRKRLPQLGCHEADDDGELSILITGMPNHQALTQRLDNAYQEFRQNPGQRKAIYARWLDGLVALVEPPKLERDKLLPFVKAREWVRNSHPHEPPEPGSPRELFHDVLNDELAVCYVNFGSNIHFLVREELAILELDEADARALALRNLRARTTERTFMDFPVGWSVHVGGNFEATTLVDDDLWNDARFQGAEWIFMAAPDRNTLLASVDASVHGVWTLSLMAATLEKSESYPISNKVFVRRNGRFEDLDPLIEDPDHPIPRLDVVDVSVESDKCERTAIIIASPLDAGPRSVYRLFRKLEGYLRHLGCDGTQAKQALPEDEKPQIQVNIHPRSHPDVLEVLNSIHDYVSKRGALLKINVTE